MKVIKLSLSLSSGVIFLLGSVVGDIGGAVVLLELFFNYIAKA